MGKSGSCALTRENKHSYLQDFEMKIKLETQNTDCTAKELTSEENELSSEKITHIICVLPI